MGEHKLTFRDFGILPENVLPPPERVRAFFSGGRVFGQYLATAIIASLGVGLATLFVWLLPPPMSILAGAAALMGFGALVYLATHHDYRWVELERETFRAKHLYSGRIVERSIDQIESLGTMVYPIRRLETVIIENLLGRVKGIEIRFRDRRNPFRVMRADPAMTNAKELIEAVVYRMGKFGELDAQIVNFNGQPLVRLIHWKDETPFVPKGNAAKVALTCFMLLALLLGMIFSFMGRQQQEEYQITSVPPQEVSLRSLVENGPGANRHITLTQFHAGGYAFEEANGHWSEVWLALFPADPRPTDGREIRAVVSSHNLGNEAAVRGLVHSGRITGICSKEPQTSWGATLGPQILGANPGSSLKSAWAINAYGTPPSAQDVRTSYSVAAACFALVILMASILFWKS